MAKGRRPRGPVPGAFGGGGSGKPPKRRGRSGKKQGPARRGRRPPSKRIPVAQRIETLLKQLEAVKRGIETGTPSADKLEAAKGELVPLSLKFDRLVSKARGTERRLIGEHVRAISRLSAELEARVRRERERESGLDRSALMAEVERMGLKGDERAEAINVMHLLIEEFIIFRAGKNERYLINQLTGGKRFDSVRLPVERAIGKLVRAGIVSRERGILTISGKFIQKPS